MVALNCSVTLSNDPTLASGSIAINMGKLEAKPNNSSFNPLCVVTTNRKASYGSETDASPLYIIKCFGGNLCEKPYIQLDKYVHILCSIEVCMNLHLVNGSWS